MSLPDRLSIIWDVCFAIQMMHSMIDLSSLTKPAGQTLAVMWHACLLGSRVSRRQYQCQHSHYLTLPGLSANGVVQSEQWVSRQCACSWRLLEVSSTAYILQISLSGPQCSARHMRRRFSAVQAAQYTHYGHKLAMWALVEERMCLSVLWSESNWIIIVPKLCKNKLLR